MIRWRHRVALRAGAWLLARDARRRGLHAEAAKLDVAMRQMRHAVRE